MSGDNAASLVVDLFRLSLPVVGAIGGSFLGYLTAVRTIRENSARERSQLEIRIAADVEKEGRSHALVVAENYRKIKIAEMDDMVEKVANFIGAASILAHQIRRYNLKVIDRQDMIEAHRDLSKAYSQAVAVDEYDVLGAVNRIKLGLDSSFDTLLLENDSYAVCDFDSDFLELNKHLIDWRRKMIDEIFCDLSSSALERKN